jgi:hypothetical protein
MGTHTTTMLNPFPVQFLGLFAYFILRVACGFVCITIGRRLLKSQTTSLPSRTIGGLLLVIGIQCILGFYTQIAALGLGFLSILGMSKPTLLPNTPRSTLFLLGAIALSLFITGAGIFAFDLPI